MKAAPSLSVFLLVTILCSAQVQPFRQPELLWQQMISNTGGQQSSGFMDASADPNGNRVSLVGYCDNEVAGSDIMAVLLDDDSRIIYKIQLESEVPALNIGYKAALDQNGYATVAGKYYVPEEGYKLLLAHISPTGNIMWKRLYDQALLERNPEDYISLHVDKAGNIYFFFSQFSAPNEGKLMVEKIHPNGNVLFTKNVKHESNSINRLLKARVATTGNFFVLIQTSDSLPQAFNGYSLKQFDTDGKLVYDIQYPNVWNYVPVDFALKESDAFLLSTNGPLAEILVEKFDDQGTKVFARNLQDTAYNFWPLAIKENKGVLSIGLRGYIDQPRTFFYRILGMDASGPIVLDTIWTGNSLIDFDVVPYNSYHLDSNVWLMFTHSFGRDYSTTVDHLNGYRYTSELALPNGYSVSNPMIKLIGQQIFDINGDKAILVFNIYKSYQYQAASIATFHKTKLLYPENFYSESTSDLKLDRLLIHPDEPNQVYITGPSLSVSGKLYTRKLNRNGETVWDREDVSDIAFARSSYKDRQTHAQITDKGELLMATSGEDHISIFRYRKDGELLESFNSKGTTPILLEENEAGYFIWRGHAWKQIDHAGHTIWGWGVSGGGGYWSRPARFAGCYFDTRFYLFSENVIGPSFTIYGPDGKVEFEKEIPEWRSIAAFDKEANLFVMNHDTMRIYNRFGDMQSVRVYDDTLLQHYYRGAMYFDLEEKPVVAINNYPSGQISKFERNGNLIWTHRFHSIAPNHLKFNNDNDVFTIAENGLTKIDELGEIMWQKELPFHPASSVHYEVRDIALKNQLIYVLMSVSASGGGSLNNTENRINNSGNLLLKFFDFGTYCVPMDDELELMTGYPNPFSSATTFCYDLKETADVQFRIYDLQGRLLSTHPVGQVEPGPHHFHYTAPPSLANGEYLVRLSAAGKETVTKIQHIK
ncbi:MAG: T9SS type A sorting domain-containing protein [Bacteroidia bacterium]